MPQLKNLLSINDLTKKDVENIFALTAKMKKNSTLYNGTIKNKHFALIFEKPSLRTRVSFEVALKDLGISPIYLSQQEVGINTRESIKDIARTLNNYVQGIVFRTFAQNNLKELAKYFSGIIINALSDKEHPCQALADFFTLYERKINLQKIKFVYIGDGNNVCNSLMLTAALLGVNFVACTPEKYKPKKENYELKEKKFTTQHQKRCVPENSKFKILITSNINEAVLGADVLYTDAWISMGQEKEAKLKLKHFKNFQLNEKLLNKANKNCVAMHCLPAHRGQEITDEVIDGKNSLIFQQAENKKWVQKAVVYYLNKVQS